MHEPSSAARLRKMALPARPESTAQCPWCSADVGPTAAECASCHFPLGHDAPQGHPDAPTAPRPINALALGPAPAVRPLVSDAELERRSRRHHRLGLVAALLALTAAMLTLSTVLSLRAVSTPEAKADRRAQSNLSIAWKRADAGTPVTGQPAGGSGADPRDEDQGRSTGNNGPTPLQVRDADVASDAPDHISIDGDAGRWFAASRSTTGHCFAVGGRLGGHKVLITTLAAPLPCSGGQAKEKLAAGLA